MEDNINKFVNPLYQDSTIDNLRAYNTKINNKYFKNKRYSQGGAMPMPCFGLIDDLDIMERIDIFDTMG